MSLPDACQSEDEKEIQEGEVGLATLSNLYCFANDPYECEVVFHGVTLDSDEEIKCQVCDIVGSRESFDDDVGDDDESDL